MSSASYVAGAGDGFAAGQLSAIAVDTSGNVVGIFDNGQSRSLYRVVLADFPAPDRLESLGDGLFRETLDSGVAAIGTPGAGGLGRVISQSVERSNVDLAQEFIDLISLQRSFQANSRVITTSDGLLNELINIVR
jgi:flagellar hook protein FlgE